MSSPKLPNYLRAFRKRLALSQEEVAYLLGSDSGAKVSRYECFGREPGLHTILAYEAIFNAPARNLFRSLYGKIERDVAARARTLLSKPGGDYRPSRIERRRKTLALIAGRRDRLISA